MAVYSGPYAITRFIVNFCGLHALTESDLATFEAALLVLFVPLSVLVCYLWFALTSWFKERGLLAKEPSDQEGHQ